MPTTSGSSTPAATTSRTVTPAPAAAEAAGLAALLADSQSATLYVDLPDMTDKRAATLLLADPALHVEFDHVRQLWAVRAAYDTEIADAKEAAAAT